MVGRVAFILLWILFGIWRYDPDTGAEVDLFTEHAERVSSIGFSPDGLTLARGGLGQYDSIVGCRYLIPGVTSDQNQLDFSS